MQIRIRIGFAFILGPYIRIQGGQNGPKKRSSEENFMFEELSVGLKAFPRVWTSFLGV